MKGEKKKDWKQGTKNQKDNILIDKTYPKIVIFICISIVSLISREP